MQFKFTTVALTTLFIAGLAAAMPSANPASGAIEVAEARGVDIRACGKKNGPCNKNGCEGINNPDTSLGICTAGPYKDCPCSNVCNNSVNSCQINGCNGKEKFGTGKGFCTAGQYNGCQCLL